MRILILYSELAGYTLACLRALMEDGRHEVCLVKWPVNREAPFQFDFDARIQVYDRDQLGDKAVAKVAVDFQPEIIFISGWMDKGYLKAALPFRQKGIPVIAGIDNQWVGSMRQRIATWMSPFLVKKYFSHMWVSGLRQYEYARRLGFDRNHIRLGYYSADVEAFSQAYRTNRETKSRQYPKRLLYVGRLVPFKGIGEVTQAFIRLAEKYDWSLQIVGAGEINVPSHPRIQVQGFVQPEALPSLAEGAGAFVLASHVEPWGVALHEFAAAGLPLLASEAVGAADAFVKDGYNGYVHKAQEVSSMAQAMERLFQLDDATLNLWGDRSHQLAQQITPTVWVSTLLSMAT